MIQTPSAVDVDRAGSDSGGPSWRASIGRRHVIALVLLFALGLMLGGGLARPLGSGVFWAFQRIADAQYQLALARENLVDGDRAEFAVLPMDEAAHAPLALFVGERADWTVRDSDLPGWMVVSVPGRQRGAAAALREQPFTRVVIRNRGLWICH